MMLVAHDADKSGCKSNGLYPNPNQVEGLWTISFLRYSSSLLTAHTAAYKPACWS